MEFRLDAGQVELQQTVARALVDRATWEEMAALGLFGMLLPDSGLDTIDAAIVFEQLGSHLTPGPVLWTVLAAGLVDGAATGARRVGGVDAGAVVDGVGLVEHAGEIDVLLVVDDERVVSRPIVEVEALDPLDPLTPVGRVRVGDGIDIGPAAELRLLGTVLSAAMLVGIATRALDVATAYAAEREQFGRPIGSFQAIKHLLADMYVRSTLAQSETYAAAVVQEPAAAARAKLLAGEAAIANAGSAIQVLGGMGFTWEMPPNELLKRAWVLEQGFGTADDHALRLGSALVDSVG